MKKTEKEIIPYLDMLLLNPYNKEESGITKREKELFILKFGDNLNHKEIAEKTGLSYNLTNRLISRATHRAFEYMDIKTLWGTTPIKLEDIKYSVSPEYAKRTWLESTGASTRLIKIFGWAEIESIEDLNSFDEKDFPKFRGMGKKGLKEISDIKKYGKVQKSKDISTYMKGKLNPIRNSYKLLDSEEKEALIKYIKSS